MVCISWPFLMQQACCLCVFNIRKRELEPTIHFPEKLLLYSYTYSSIWTAQVLCEQNLACSSFILVRRDDWRESSQILRAQTEFVRLKIRRKGKLTIPDVQLLRNWALLFVFETQTLCRAELHYVKILDFLEAAEVEDSHLPLPTPPAAFVFNSNLLKLLCWTWMKA